MNSFVREILSLTWAMHPRHLDVLIARLNGITDEQIESKVRAITERPELLERLRTGQAPMNLKRRASDVKESDLDLRNGVAHIQLSGPMMKQVPSIMNWLGIKATSTEAAREELAVAVESDAVESIVLDIDSPGGTVDGTAALAADVAAANSLKPVKAVVPDLMASAAMWVGSQAGEIEVGPSAEVGSIGTYAVVDDTHRKWEKAGVHTHVVSSHPLKGAFVEGSRVTQEQLDDLQRNMHDLTEVFVKAVAEGRGMDEDAIRELATGQTWVGAQAVALGLADRVVATVDLPARAAEAAVLPVASSAMSTRAVKPSDPQSIDFGNMALAAIEAIEESNAATPAASQETDTMTEQERKELEELREKNAALAEQNAELEADAEAARLKAKAANIAAREGLLRTYARKIKPAMQDEIAGFVMDENRAIEKAEAFLESLPDVVHSERDSAVPRTGAYDVDPALVARLGHKALIGMPKVAAFLGTNPKRVEAIDNLVDGAFSDGTFGLKDGRRVTAEQLKEILAQA